MIAETYAVFAAWDFGFSKMDNLDRLRRENFIGASTMDLASGHCKGAESAVRSS